MIGAWPCITGALTCIAGCIIWVWLFISGYFITTPTFVEFWSFYSYIAFWIAPVSWAFNADAYSVVYITGALTIIAGCIIWAWLFMSGYIITTPTFVEFWSFFSYIAFWIALVSWAFNSSF